MDYQKFENNVQNYTSAVKEKMLVINGNTVSIDNKVDDVKSEITTLTDNLSNLDRLFQKYVNDNSAYFANVDSSIASMKTKANALDASVVSLMSADSLINSSISGIKNDISTLLSWKTTHATEYQNLVNADSLINSSISSMKAKESALDASVVSLINADIAINSSINSMRAKESALDTSVKALITSDTNINSSISAIKTSLGNSSDASTANSIYGLIAALRADFESYELITAAALTDISARLDNANIA